MASDAPKREELLPPVPPEFQTGFAAKRAIVTSHLGEAQFIARELGRLKGRRVYKMPLGTFHGWISVPKKVSYERAPDVPDAILLAAAGAPGARAMYLATIQVRRLCQNLEYIAYFGRAESTKPGRDNFTSISSPVVSWGELPGAVLDIKTPGEPHDAIFLGDPKLKEEDNQKGQVLYTNSRRLATPLDCAWVNNRHGDEALHDLALAGFCIGRSALLPEPEALATKLLEKDHQPGASKKTATPASILVQPALSAIWLLDEAIPHQDASQQSLRGLEGAMSQAVAPLIKK